MKCGVAARWCCGFRKERGELQWESRSGDKVQDNKPDRLNRLDKAAW